MKTARVGIEDYGGRGTNSAVCYGDRRNSTGNLGTDKLFTGQRLDSTGLYYYNARYYDPEIGRFISADTIVPNFKNPQALNRYSYVLNNPLKYIDPSGLDPAGHANVGNETYIIDEKDGKYRVVGMDGSTSGWWNSLAELRAAWGRLRWGTRWQ